jgi:hypothetical protein
MGVLTTIRINHFHYFTHLIELASFFHLKSKHSSSLKLLLISLEVSSLFHLFVDLGSCDHLTWTGLSLCTPHLISYMLCDEDQWNRIEDPDMNPYNYTHLIFGKGTKNIQWRKDSLFNKSCWEKWLAICKTLKLHLCLSPCTTINSKWIKDLNFRPQTLNLVQESVGNALEVIGLGKTSSIKPQQLSN